MFMAIVAAEQHMNGDPIKRFVLLVLWQAQQDGATELVVAPAISGRPPIRYKVDGTWYDVSPPPSQILPGVVAELERLAQLGLGPFPKEGTIDVSFGAVRLRWAIRMVSADAECILTQIPPEPS